MRPPRLVPRIRRKLQASPAEQPNVSQSITAAVNHVRQLQLEQQAASTFPVSNRSSNATDTFSELHEQLGAVLAEAQAQPHWNSNPEGFYTCLDNVELLFRQLFFKSPETDATSLTIQPTHDNLSQCINTILPVLLIPQQSPAPNIAGMDL